MFGVVGLLVVVGALAATASGTSGAIPTCTAKSLEAKVDTNGATGKILIYVTLWNVGGRACLAQGHMLLSLHDAKTHKLLRVLGNPHGRRVDGRLRAGRNNMFTLQWSNDCGPGRPMLFEARFGKRRATERSNYPGARCDEKSQPSRLELFRLPR